MIRVGVVAQSVVVRAGLEALLTADTAFDVVSVSSIADLAQQWEIVQPDVVLLEWDQQEDLSGLLQLLEPDLALTAIALLVDDPQAPWITEALRAGVKAVLPAESTADEIGAAVAAVAAGLVILHPDTLDSLTATLPALRPLPSDPVQPLTPREIEVLRMLAEGLGNKAIAHQLHISEHTVKFHVASILSKLKASSRTEAVMLGARQGLILF